MAGGFVDRSQVTRSLLSAFIPVGALPCVAAPWQSGTRPRVGVNFGGRFCSEVLQNSHVAVTICSVVAELVPVLPEILSKGNNHGPKVLFHKEIVWRAKYESTIVY